MKNLLLIFFFLSFTLLKIDAQWSNSGDNVTSGNIAIQDNSQIRFRGIGWTDTGIGYNSGTETVRISTTKDIYDRFISLGGYLGTAWYPQLTLNTKTGCVGVGTYQQANWGAKFVINNTDNYSKLLQLGADGPTTWFMGIGNESGSIFHIGENNEKRFVIQRSSGNVGIGTTTPKTRLEVRGDVYSDNGWASRVSASNATADRQVFLGTFSTGNAVVGAHNYGLSEWRNLYINSFNGTDGGNVIVGGNVGIGTTTPKTRLEVRGDVYSDNGWASRVSASNATADRQVFLGTFNTGNAVVGAHNYGLSEWRDLYLNSYYGTDGGNVVVGGRVGVGTKTPQAKLHLNNGDNSYGAILAQATETAFHLYTKTLTTPINTEAFRIGLKYSSDERNGYISFYRGGDTFGGFLGFSTNGLERIRIAANGYVGIGTSQPKYMLDVLGTIRAEEVIVNLDGLADYVFEPTYNLKPLAEVEKFVKEEKHLPEMPSAAEVADKGMNMGEMQNKLLQKIEELTLYVIELEKINKAQEEKLSRVDKLEKDLELLKLIVANK